MNLMIFISSLAFFLGILGATTLIEEYRDMSKRRKITPASEIPTSTKTPVSTSPRLR